MKKTISLTIALVLCVLALASCSRADNYVPAGYKKASNERADYKLYVPESWTVDMSTGVTTAYATDKSNISFIGFELDDTIIRFDTVKGSTDDNTDEAPKDTVTSEETSGTEEIPDDTTVVDTDDIVDDTEDSDSISDTNEISDDTTSSDTDDSNEDPKKDIVTVKDYWEYYSKTFESTFSDMEYITKGESTVISGIKAEKYVYKATVTDDEYVFMQVIAIKNKSVFIFTYTARENAYESHLEEVTEMLGYLEIK